jgi:murein L,D-transpeptidase YafK
LKNQCAQKKLFAEIYLAAVDARTCGQTRIPVHIFPGRMTGPQTEADRLAWRKPILQAFRINLQEGFIYFEARHVLPKISSHSKGKYHFSDSRQ